MDLSKLPKLSDTPKRETDATSAPTVARQSPMPAAPAAGPEVWISIAVGVITLLIYPRFLQWSFSRLFSTPFNEFMKSDGSGMVVPYTQVPEFWSDLGITLFGIVLILEGIALVFARHTFVVWIAFVLTLGMVGYNLAYVVLSYSTYGLALVSAFAVAFGVYIAAYQWRLLSRSRNLLAEGQRTV
jgi:hypothetical protein